MLNKSQVCLVRKINYKSSLHINYYAPSAYNNVPWPFSIYFRVLFTLMLTKTTFCGMTEFYINNLMRQTVYFLDNRYNKSTHDAFKWEAKIHTCVFLCLCMNLYMYVYVFKITWKRKIIIKNDFFCFSFSQRCLIKENCNCFNFSSSFCVEPIQIFKVHSIPFHISSQRSHVHFHSFHIFTLFSHLTQMFR